MKRYRFGFPLFALLWMLVGCGSPPAQDESVSQASPVPTLESLEPPILEQLASAFPRNEFVVGETDGDFSAWVWPESEPEAQGLDSSKLAEIEPYVEEELKQIHSVLVVRNGVLVYEYYADGRTRDSGDIVWSVTKSFTSLLVGIAIDEGLIKSIDQPIVELLDPAVLEGGDPDLAGVTVEQLLTMSSGVSCRGDGCHDDTLESIVGRDLSDAPGEAFVYDTGSTHLLSGALENVTGLPLHAYATDKIFEPLGIVPPPWEIDDKGMPFGGKGLAMRPRDLAKFGQMLLDEGFFDGERVVSEGYLEAATQDQVVGLTDERYGYLFWLGDGFFSAVGYGGQYVTVVPEEELVVVITSDFMPARDGSNSIVEPFILGAIEE